MSELSQFLPGLQVSVREARQRRREEAERQRARQDNGGGIAAAKARAAENRAKVLAALIAAGQAIGITAIAQRTGLGYNSAGAHLNALVADGEAKRLPGGRGLYLTITSKDDE